MGMIFCARQVVEKAREHNTKIYMLFVDLRKAYDLVPRQALWDVKYGIPAVLVKLIQSMHNGMKAEVQVQLQSLMWRMVCDRAVPLPQHCLTSTSIL